MVEITKEHKFQRILQKHIYIYTEREREREGEMVEITRGFGFEIVGNRGRAVVLDGAGEDGSERDERRDGGKR